MFVGTDQIRLVIVSVVILLTDGAVDFNLSFWLCLGRFLLLGSTGSHYINAIKNEKLQALKLSFPTKIRKIKCQYSSYSLFTLMFVSFCSILAMLKHLKPIPFPFFRLNLAI